MTTGNSTRISIRRCYVRATVKKFMVGYEMLGMPRDITANKPLIGCARISEIHYTEAAESA